MGFKYVNASGNNLCVESLWDSELFIIFWSKDLSWAFKIELLLWLSWYNVAGE